MLREIVRFDLLYYVQTDVICLLFLFLLIVSNVRIKERTADRKLFLSFIVVTILFTIFDLMTWTYDGKPGRFQYAMLQISNVGFFITTTLVSVLWFYYVDHLICQNKGKNFKPNLWVSMPFILFSVFVVFNPLHELIWVIDPANNEYSRGSFIYIHWVLVALYLIVPTVILFISMKQEKSIIERKKYTPAFFIMGIPIITAVLQGLFYGVSLLQIGMTSTILYTYVKQQNTHVYMDELTGVYNRRYFNHYFKEKYDNIKASDELFLLMIDIDHFKSINDTLGHLMGDNVLKTTGYILRTAVFDHKSVIASRYGGDEFVIFGVNTTREAIDQIIKRINDLVQNENDNDHRVEVHLSIGEISGKRGTFTSTDEILSAADEMMYKIKNEKYVKTR